jgi:hypothetical protein
VACAFEGFAWWWQSLVVVRRDGQRNGNAKIVSSLVYFIYFFGKEKWCVCWRLVACHVCRFNFSPPPAQIQEGRAMAFANPVPTDTL